MYEDIYDAKTAVEHLSGFNVANRYLIVLYYNTAKQNKKVGVALAYCNVQMCQAGKCVALQTRSDWAAHRHCNANIVRTVAAIG